MPGNDKKFRVYSPSAPKPKSMKRGPYSKPPSSGKKEKIVLKQSIYFSPGNNSKKIVKSPSKG